MMTAIEGALAMVKEWQTLITGMVAILAAWIAARPVWRQLTRMEMQTDTMLREIFIRRIGEVGGRLKSLTAPVREVVDVVSRDLGWWAEGARDEMTGEWAFHQEGGLRSAQVRVAAHRASYRDADAIEALKDDLETAVEALIELLDRIHRPDSLDPTDPERPIGAVQWHEIELSAAEAKQAIAGAVVKVHKACEAIESAYREEGQRLRGKLVELDTRLTVA